MNRRDVLKGLGLTVGYAVATPSIFSLLQSCKTEAEIWVPQFLTLDEGIVLKNLVNLILPKTKNLPGALDVNVPEFIDLYVYKTYDDEAKEEFKIGFDAVVNALNIPEKGPSELKPENYDALLAKYLKLHKEQQEIIKQNEEDEDTIILIALENIRNMSIWAYKTSEEVGENILIYDPIPGVDIGCMSLKDATGGKEWSL
jgi:predicted nucleotide-binding protein (sugar kinase/HSP70/actin superfamily)